MKRSSLIFSILVILAGVVLLASKLGYFTQGLQTLLCWPALILIIGFIMFANRQYKCGSFVALFGFFFLMPRLGTLLGWNLPENFVRLYWPLLILLAGLYMLLDSFTKKRNTKCGCGCHRYTPFKEVHEDAPQADSQTAANADAESETETILDRKIMMTDWHYLAPKAPFAGGIFESMMASSTLDLRQAVLTRNVVLNVANLMGEIVIIVPSGWNVQFVVDTFAADSHDRRINATQHVGPQLTITGKCTLGEMTLRD